MLNRLTHRLQPVTPVLVSMLIVVVIAVGYAQVSSGAERAATLLVVYVTLVVGMYVFSGMSGVISFGHASFLAVAGYMSAYLTIQPTLKGFFLPGLPGFLATAHLSLVPAMIVSGLAAAAFAGLIGYPLMRLKGIEASVATFSVTVIAYAVTTHWKAMTSGKSSITVPITTSLVIALATLFVVLSVAFAFQQSRWGLLLRVAREDDVAAASIGARVHGLRFVGWILSGFLTGIAGSLYVHYLGALSPDSFWLAATFLPIAMLIVGGMKSLSGAVVGAVAVWGIAEILYTFEKGVAVFGVRIDAPANVRELGLGAVLLLILIFRPSGIMGGNEFDLRPVGSWLRGRARRLRTRGRPKEEDGRPATSGRSHGTLQ